MKYTDKFTKEEINLTNKLLNKYYNPYIHKDKSLLLYFINEWLLRVEQFEKGYTLTIDDYTNEITVRDILEELINEVPENLKLKVVDIIIPIDEKFKEITNAVKNPLMLGLKGENPPWWWYRIPKKLVGELKEDVESLKIV